MGINWFSCKLFVNLYQQSVVIDCRSCSWLVQHIETSPEQSGGHSADKIFKCFFLKAKFYILIKILLKFDPGNVIDTQSALVREKRLVPYRYQAITWTKNDSANSCLYICYQGLKKLSTKNLGKTKLAC